MSIEEQAVMDPRIKQQMIIGYTSEIAGVKRILRDMDYKTSKFADGEYTSGEWAEIVAARQELRQRISALETGLAELQQPQNAGNGNGQV